ncbi:MAG: hypothetical protein ACYDCC_13495 [Actinomycetota bacterium]
MSRAEKRRGNYSTVLVTLFVGALLCGLIGSAPTAPMGFHRTAAPPQGLLNDLSSMDSQLTSLIAALPSLSAGQLGTRVSEIRNLKLGMMDRFYNQEIYGVKYSVVFRKLDDIDMRCEQADRLLHHGVTTVGGLNDAVNTLDRAVIDRLELRNSLAASEGVPQGLLKSLDELDLASLRKQAQDIGNNLANFSHAVSELRKDKIHLVNVYFDQKIYGVGFGTVFEDLDSVDLNLLIGQASKFALWFDHALSEVKSLQDDFRSANSPPAGGSGTSSSTGQTVTTGGSGSGNQGNGTTKGSGTEIKRGGHRKRHKHDHRHRRHESTP